MFEAGHIVLTKPLKGCSNLKRWAMQLAKRVGITVGSSSVSSKLGRRLAVIMHRMLVDGTPYDDRKLGEHNVAKPAAIAA